MTLPELEKTVSGLPAEDLSRFRAWFLEFDAKNRDEQIENDMAAGRLDYLADQAIREQTGDQ